MTFKRYTIITLLSLSSMLMYAIIPDGYYSSVTSTGESMKTELHNIIKNHSSKSYDYLWTAFQTTDDKANGKVWDMYSDIPNETPPYEYSFGTNQCGNYSGENSCYNREHSFPKSWFDDATPMYTDLFHLYPTDGYVNGKRSNYPFGEVESATWTSENGSKLGTCSYPGYSGTVFEPIDVYKGDFARTYFYMATRYEDIISTWHSNSTEAEAVLQNNSFPVYETWFLNMLAEWHVNDPVSDKETERNDAVYAIQGNRNPFIDHPEYVNAIWGVGEVTESGNIQIGRVVAINSTLNFGKTTSSVNKTIHIKTTDITSDLTVTVSGEGFSSTTSTISKANAESGYDLTISFNPVTTGNYSGNLTIAGGGLNPAYQVILVGEK